MSRRTPQPSQPLRIEDPPCASTLQHFNASKFCRAFTLVEVLASMLLLAIVIPAAVEALHTAAMAGEVAARKGQAARVADQVLNQSIVATNWNFGTQSGTSSDGGRQFRWTLTSRDWPEDSLMRQLTAQVSFTIQGINYSLQMSTLATLAASNVLTGPIQ